ncbi:DUF4355 domain-containing protein [Clostridium botulinum]|uniref:DUF4355 domain-containing protein n=1 Tax=Clostridium botulinum TaxID=1491 RepID=UPI000174E4C0|nr:DUF4355 domain-containing protein [Clostridium botulinum]ACD52851.1 conserved hypothetical protein [Clostridium botulinum E3 str. Alaska E43]MCR1159367.1 DUF4355 domain-containing protein [Clostridium botulinum]NFG46915.1 DUF4355 domain-containing protein [Clostridium botulinum]NFQ94724.1 DUF4355 domain-containing protein [Clostridium botulinum]
MEEVNNQNVEIEESEKSIETGVDNVDTENNSTGEITLEQFQNAIANNLEVKGYYDSIVDKSVSKRLDKGIESWKEKNLENIIDEEINKRYPQKTEAEIKFEEQQEQLEKAMEEKRQLELQIKYQTIMAENNLPMEILDFVTGKDVETTISNIERFKSTTDTYIAKKVQDGIEERLRRNVYIPPSNDNNFGSSYGSMWD